MEVDPKLLLYLVLFFCVTYPLYYLVRSITGPLRNVSGPFLARFSDLWFAWQVKTGDFELTNIELHKAYGPIVRYGPNRYSISDPAAINIIYGHGTKFAKSSWYTPFQVPNHTTIFTERSIKDHSSIRRLYQNTYSMTALVDYEPYVDSCADIFSQRLTETAKAGKSIDMAHWFQCYAFDVIAEMTFGKRFGFLDAGQDPEGLMPTLDQGMFYGAFVGIFPKIHPIATKLMNIMAGKKGSGRTYIHRFTATQISAHQESVKGGLKTEKAGKAESFLSKFLTKHQEDPERFTFFRVTAGCSTNIGAGSDTTGISLSAVFYYLLRNPQYLQKLRDEIEGFPTESRGSVVSFKESQQLPYLQAVIKETLRIHSATGMPLERVVPEGGASICGTYFPAGTIVGVNPWVIHRDKQIFGLDAEKFNPDRWFTGDEEKLAAMNRAWIPFGLGSRTCIGRHISTLEMYKLIPRLIRDFDFRLSPEFADPGSYWKTRNILFVKPQGLEMTVSSRNRASPLIAC
ncbi:cytochrome P450 [Xylariaceae sp. FL0255]|nr:cytochrome P450 [Xylariaceae sp. FL0255]